MHCLFLQKCLIGLSTGLLWGMDAFSLSPPKRSVQRPFDALFGVLVVAQALLKIIWAGVHIGMEKDYPAVIARDHNQLSRLNANLKKVDLFCKLAVPIGIALLAQHTSLQLPMPVIILFAICAAFIELYCMRRVYKAYPKLGVKWRDVSSDPVGPSSALLSPAPLDGDQNGKPLSVWALVKKPIFLTTVSVSVLYMNVLAFSGILISYLTVRGLDSSVIATIKGLCVLCGLSATFTFPSLVKQLGLVRLGVFATVFQAVVLTVTVGTFYTSYASGVSNMILLFGGIACSRWALWSFDMVQTQLLQETLAKDIGLATGIQISLQNVFEMAAYAVSTVWSLPDDFYIPATISLGIVYLSALIFAVYAAAAFKK
ncbi:hypothetical protein HDV03_001571 [Kappamyces sp. JEL0829]|nr:hypothetical protein HDV03_001571 [Kappamyces sp. JEL0829]